MTALGPLIAEIQSCRICADRFAATETAHKPHPVVRVRKHAPILIIGQAPGARVHESGIPFDDRSGDRLRDWLGVDRDAFYDRDLFSIMPMAFCFPGYNARKSDLPPPPICAKTWHKGLRAGLTPEITLLVGGYAQKREFGPAAKGGVTATVSAWRDHAPRRFPLPHPSWRNTGWIRNNPWFEAELLPELRQRVKEVLYAKRNSD
ncbi:uracil-DNA glycosylase family protein [Halocynthiibacter sp. C4]|uniref:uracil-DNA glycosylase family protein n=1 Tax=Halocynthiibacter sp. C4 TaxID=2992758 RepID=UPI00237ADDF7|nr:uracil-DNA glycosylase family protein [Halocynthiibacter sp. C4]MDE0590504.1 uracil-DNA glycosylase family protein [Halocynthiibacter sp. C4]